MELHYYQSEIIKKLMYNPRLKFSNLQIEGLSSKHFNYHLQELVKLDLIKKNENVYELTILGKEYVAKVDEASMQIESQPKVNVGVLVERVNEYGKKEYLLSKRLKHPYYGKVGGITGKVRFGEKTEDTARRELFEETGLTGDFQFSGIVRKMSYTDNKVTGNREFVQDQVMFLFRVTNTVGEFKPMIKDQENFWQDYEGITKRKDLFNTFLKYLDISINKRMDNIEYVAEAEGF